MSERGRERREGGRGVKGGREGGRRGVVLGPQSV